MRIPMRIKSDKTWSSMTITWLYDLLPDIMP